MDRLTHATFLFWAAFNCSARSFSRSSSSPEAFRSSESVRAGRSCTIDWVVTERLGKKVSVELP